MAEQKVKRQFLCIGCRCAEDFNLADGTVFCKRAEQRISAIVYTDGMKFEECEHRKVPADGTLNLVKLAQVARALGTSDPKLLPMIDG